LPDGGTRVPPRGKLESVPICIRAAPFAAFIFLLAAAPHSPLLRGLGAAVLLAIFWPRYTELRVPLARRETVVALLVGVLVFIIWIALDMEWARFADDASGYRPLTSTGAIDWPRAAARFAVLAAVVPVMEELFWRSLLMRWIDARAFLALDARHVSRTAVVLSSALFALEHSLWLAGLIAGLAYAGLYITTNNLRAPVLAHAVTNAILGLWIVATGSWHLW
jgi:CAAX prenyl protease-like protein